MPALHDPAGGMTLSGRDVERSLITSAAASLDRHGPVAIVVDGPRGSGKTALIENSLESSPGLAVLRASARRGDEDSPLSTALQLIAGRVDQKLGSDLSPADVSAALRDLLAGEGKPRVLFIDNTEWIDQQSAAVLTAILRGLRGAAVLVLLSGRGVAAAPPPARPHIARLIQAALDHPSGRMIRLGPLRVSDVQLLIRRAGIADPSLCAAKRLHAYTGGNPALVAAVLDDLPETLRTDSAVLQPPVSVRAATAVTLAALPAPSRALAAALATLGETASLAVASRIAGDVDGVAALEPLIGEGLVTWQPRDPTTPVGMATPVERDAVYQSLDPRERRKLHARVARTVSGAHTWHHRMAAAAGADPGLAEALVQTARREIARGDRDQAGRLMTWAAAVADDKATAEHYLLTAGTYLAWAPRPQALAALVPQLENCGPSPLRDLALGMIAYRDGKLAQAELLLGAGFAALDEQGPHDDAAIAAGLLLAAVYSATDRAAAEEAVVRRLLDMPLSPSRRAWATYFLADSAGRASGGASTALAVLESTMTTDLTEGDPANRPLLLARGIWRVLAGRLNEGASDLRDAWRASERDDLLATTSAAFIALGHYLAGSWDAAAAVLDDALLLAEARAQTWHLSPVYAVAACLAAGRGDATAAATHLRAAEACYRMVRTHASHVYAALAGAVVAQADADYATMLDQLSRIAQFASAGGEVSFYELWWRPLYAEALLGTNQLANAGEVLADLAALGERIPQLRLTAAWLHGWQAHLTGDVRTARDIFEQAIEQPSSTDEIALHRARLEQAYGEFLLTRQNRRAAVYWLRKAHERYLAMRARPYAERCAALLRACGIEGGDEAGAAVQVLSAHEYKVAHLVASGLTNKEAARELFVSPKTVEYHLGNIFTKLGISSRRELRAALTKRIA